MPANLANSAEATGQERSVFIPIAKKSNAREYLDYCTIVLISEASKILLKVLQDRFQQYMNCKLPGVKPGFRKGVGTSNQIAYLCRIIEKARKLKKKSTYPSLTLLKSLAVWITANCGIFFKRWECQTTMPAF